MSGRRPFLRPSARKGGSALAAALAAAAIAVGGPAAAGQVSLRGVVASTGDITLADLFDNAGSAGAVVVGYGAPPGESAVLDAAAVQRIARDHGLDWSNPDGVRRIVVPAAAGPMARSPQTLDVLTYTRSLMAGEVVQPEDLTFARTPIFAVPADAPRDAQAVIGKAARRPLRSGAPVAAHDVGPAQVIHRDDMVEVSYSTDGINLVLQGKAQAAAAVGEPVDILNTASKKVVQAIATGPGQAVVGPQADQIRAAVSASAPTQFAALK
jgi:flagella basal body P-ring formation protein FlgA